MKRNPTSELPPRRRGDLVVLFAVAVLVTIGLLPRITRAEEAEMAVVGLSEVPEIDVALYPLGHPLPIPVPELPQGRLQIESLGGELVLDVVPFDTQGAPIESVFDEIDRVFSARDGSQTNIHPRLVELLITLSNAFEGRPITLVSAHRKPGRGTSKTSYHVRGMAADVIIRGVKVRDVRKAALRLGAKGVGLYPSFLHVDVRDDRPAYQWSGGGWRRWRRR